MDVDLSLHTNRDRTEPKLSTEGLQYCCQVKACLYLVKKCMGSCFNLKTYCSDFLLIHSSQELKITGCCCTIFVASKDCQFIQTDTCPHRHQLMWWGSYVNVFVVKSHISRYSNQMMPKELEHVHPGTSCSLKYVM